MKRISRYIMTMVAAAAMLSACDFRNELIDLHHEIDTEDDVSIKSIQAQLDAIKETIPDLEQLRTDLNTYLTALEEKEKSLTEAIGESNNELQSLRSNSSTDIYNSSILLDSEIEQYESDMERQLEGIRAEIERLQQEDVNLGEQIDALKEYVDHEVSGLYDWANQTFMTLELYNTLCSTVAGVETDLETANSRMQTLFDAVAKQFETDFPAAMSNMETELKNKVAEVGNELQPQLETAVSELTDAYNTLFDKKFDEYETKMKSWVNSQLDGYYTMAQTDSCITRLGEELDEEIDAQHDYIINLLQKLSSDIMKEVSDNKVRIASLRASLNDIDPTYQQNIEDLAGLAVRISSNADDIASNTAAVEAEDDEIDDLNALIDENSKLIAENKNAIDGLNSSFDALKSRIALLKDDQQRLIESVASNAKAIAANAELIQANITAMNSCANQIAQNDSDLATIRSSINSMSSELKAGYDAAIESAINTMEGKFNKAISDSVKLINSRINDIAANTLWTYNSLKTRTSNVGKQVDSLKTTLSEIEASVAGIKTSIGELLARIQSVTYVPENEDGNITVTYTYGREGSATATLNYCILPSGLATDLAANPSKLHVFAIAGVSGSTESECAISSISASGDVLTVIVSAGTLPDEFFAGTSTVYMSLNISDSNTDIQSTYTAAAPVPQDADMIIPDANFKSYLLSNYDMNSDGNMTLRDSVLFHQKYEGTNVSIWVDKFGITSMEGLKYFPDITTLGVSHNNITSLDLSGNPKLKVIECSYCLLQESPDFSSCKALENLYCYVPTFTSLTLADMPALKSIEIDGKYDFGEIFAYPVERGLINALTISNCPQLWSISANYNKISSLKFQGCPELSTLMLISNYLDSFDGTNLPALTSLSVDGNNVSVLDCSDCTSMKRLMIRECRNLMRLDCPESMEEIDFTNQNTQGYFGENEHNTGTNSTVWVGYGSNIQNIIVPDSCTNIWAYSGCYTAAITSNVLNPDFRVLQGTMPSTFYVKDYEGTSVDMANVITGIATIDFTQSPNITEINAPEGYSNTIVANDGVEIKYY